MKIVKILWTISLLFNINVVKIDLVNSELDFHESTVDINKKNTTASFSNETTKIINEHNKDFNVNNFHEKMEEYGGYEKYLKSLGGVFGKWVDKTPNATTATEFQEIAEYVLGLMVLYGMDYCNNNPSSYTKWMANDGVTDDAFYPRGTDNGNKYLATYDENDIDKICSGSLTIASAKEGMNMVVDCATGIDRILNKAGIKRAGDCYQVVKLIENGAKIVTKTSDLQVGDLIEVYLNRISNKSKSGFTDSTFGWSGWIHVMIVGDIDKEAGKITFYETGHDFTNTGNCKVVKNISDNPYHGFEWVGIRAFDLVQDLGKGWKTYSDGNKVYIKDNGKKAENEWLTIDGEKFHFDSNGYLQTGFLKIGNTYYELNTDSSKGTLGKVLYYMTNVNGNWVYYNANGKKVSGWLFMDGNYYYLNNQGIMCTGWKKISSIWYYFDSKGIMQTGWLKDNNQWYYLKETGAMATGWALDGDTWYYLDENGIMQSNGWKYLNDRWYYLNKSGSMKTGWLKYNNNWYYLKETGAMATGWALDGDTWYYLDENGIMQTGWKKINDVWYYFNNSGSMKTGWYRENDTWYYLNSSGNMAKEWLLIDGKWYYFDNSGRMLVGWQTIKNKKYYFDMSGAMRTGWLKENTDWYYFDESGAMATGWKLVNDNNKKTYWYYFDENGVMQKNTWIGKYYLSDSGAMEGEQSSEDRTVLGKVTIIVSALRIRSGPGTNYSQKGYTHEKDEYSVLGIKENNGYTWYQISENSWIADDGTYLRYTEK